jgi:MFS transporter, DHA1 family, tetracycline resistance protein
VGRRAPRLHRPHPHRYRLCDSCRRAQTWWVYPGIAFTAVGSGFATPALTGILSRRVDARQQGTLMGVQQSNTSLTRIFGPVWAGLLFDGLGPAWPYWTGAVIILASWALVRAAVKVQRSA